MSKDITLVLVDHICNPLAQFSIQKTLEVIDCKDVLTFGTQPFVDGATHVTTEVNDLWAYSEIILKQLYPLIKTEHVLVIQWDGMAITPELWTDDFLKYDYIGAIWPWPTNGIAMGNGGFSLRSRKLLEACQNPEIQLGGIANRNEDIAICVKHRDQLVKDYGIQYAPLDVARRFSTENEWLGPTFGFHGLWNIPRFFTEDECAAMIELTPEYYWESDNKTNALLRTLHEAGYTDLFKLVQTK